MKKDAADEKPVTRRAMRSRLEDHQSSIESWVLGALALISAHIVQFVSIGLPWKGEPRGGESVTGWELATANYGTGLWQLGSILVLAVSVVVAFLALPRRQIQRQRQLLKLVAILSIARAVLIVKVSTSVQVRDWGTQPGVTVAVLAALATAVTALVVVSVVAD